MTDLFTLSNQGITVRAATEADLPIILEIYNEAILNSAALFEYYAFTVDYIGKWFENKKANNFPVFVACVNEEVFGFCSYGHFRERPGYKYTVESTVYIHQIHRGKGIGKLLVSYLNDYAISQNFHTIIACIEASNLARINLHKGQGYEQVAEFKQVGYKFDRWLTLLFFQLILPTPECPNCN
jgi:phosphinothricin acetyltransferase